MLPGLSIMQSVALIPLFPLLAALIITLSGARVLKSRSWMPAVIGVAISAVLALSLLVMFQRRHIVGVQHLTIYHWISSGGFSIPIGIYVDPLTSLFLVFVTFVSTLIFIYSCGYMQGDYGYFRFFAYLSLFVFFMCTLVLADNFVLLYLGWEGVGLASYLLVGYYYTKPSAREAAKKAFIVNRIGDTCLAIAIFIIYLVFHTETFSRIFQSSDLKNVGFLAAHHGTLIWIALLLMFGAFAKSAQFPLHVWLPDAMEGPTPVSALIHAATMVTAGVYLIARCMPLFTLAMPVLHLVGVVGCFTAFMAATIAMCQYDMKRIWAYSTVSQLGYMFMALGVASGTAAVFHVFTHAFFKALLFLSTGSVMHAMGGELDIRKMSGIRKVMPITAGCLLIGALALSGFPGFSGFFSKDEILTAAMNASWNWGPLLSVVGFITALITAYYTFRVFFRVFMGDLVLPATAGKHEPSAFVLPEQARLESSAAHGSHGNTGHETDGHKPSDGSAAMWMPLIILACGAALAGYLGVFGGANGGGWIQSFLSPVHLLNGAAHPVVITPGTHIPVQTVSTVRVAPAMLMGAGAVLVLLGVLVAAYFHWANRRAADAVGAALAPVVKFLENKWYIDELYNYGIVQPLWLFGQALSIFDRFVVDGVVFMIGFFPQFTGYVLKPTQSGRLRYYGIGMIAGVAVVILGVLYLLR